MTSSFGVTWGMLLALGSAALGCEMSGAPDDDAGGGSSGRGGSASGGTGGGAPDEVRRLLEDPAVQSALDEVREAGVDIAVHTETEAPDPTGYYSYALGAGTWVASGNGANVGFGTTAAELRVDLLVGDLVDTGLVGSFDGVTPASYAVDRGYLLRGAGDEVTLYGRRSTVCNLSGSPYVISQVYIWTGTLQAGTGDWVEQRQLIVTTATEGERTSECDQTLVGNAEVVGGWAIAAIPVATKVGVDDLQLMCVDGSRGYVPQELWSRTDGTTCACTLNLTLTCGER